MNLQAPSATVFHTLDTFVAHPRLTGLALSPDGSRLVTTVATCNPDETAYVNALWEIDPAGERPAHRLTHGVDGESAPTFTVNGDLLFTSARRPATSKKAASKESEPNSLWQLDAAGGEAHHILTRPGGFTSVQCAARADVTMVGAPVLPGANDEQQHARLHEIRTDSGVDAILHQGYPIRYWDHDLGPAQPQLFTLSTTRELLPVSGDMGASLVDQTSMIAPSGEFALIMAVVPEAAGEQRTVLIRIDVASGEQTRLIDEAGLEVDSALISPDSAVALVSTSPIATPTAADHPTLTLIDLATGEQTPVATEWDRWGVPAAWLPDSSAVLVLADDHGRGPVFSLDPATGVVRQLTDDESTYSAVVVPTTDNPTVAYGVRSSLAFPAEVVRIDLATGAATPLLGPTVRPELPGELSDVTTTTQDGTHVRGWLATPQSGNGPAPLLVFIHGGPLSSWNAWTWRWNPWVLVAQGYAVLLPDPALSTGYGQEFVQRGWGAWGAAPYTDILALTDAVEARDDIDADRTAALGGSFGGYMANWVAGHTDRFKAIVTHASLWALDGFGRTTDAAFYWQRQVSDQMAVENSPHRFVEQIVTPMLVIHGDKDYRVPISEGLRLWYDLLSSSGLPADADGSTVHRFLYFPHENHWILAPQHAKVWYQAVRGFLDEHVLGAGAAALPAELGLTAPHAEEATA